MDRRCALGDAAPSGKKAPGTTGSQRRRCFRARASFADAAGAPRRAADRKTAAARTARPAFQTARGERPYSHRCPARSPRLHAKTSTCGAFALLAGSASRGRQNGARGDRKRNAAKAAGTRRLYRTFRAGRASAASPDLAFTAGISAVRRRRRRCAYCSWRAGRALRPLAACPIS